MVGLVLVVCIILLMVRVFICRVCSWLVSIVVLMCLGVCFRFNMVKVLLVVIVLGSVVKVGVDSESVMVVVRVRGFEIVFMSG